MCKACRTAPASFLFIILSTCISIFVLLIGGYIAFSALSQTRLSNKGSFLPVGVSDTLIANGVSDFASFNGGAQLSATSKIVWLVMDGMRYDAFTSQSVLANIVSTNSADLLLHKVKSEIPTLSYPNYEAMAMGSPPEMTGTFGNSDDSPSLSDVLTFQADLNEYTPPPYESIFDTAKRAGLSATYRVSESPAGKAYWEKNALKVYDGSVDGSSDKYIAYNYSTVYCDSVGSGFGSVNTAQFRVLFYEGFDHAGHRGPVGSDLFKEIVECSDAMIKAIINAIDTDTTLIITSDHGVLDEGGHSGVEKHLVDVPVLIYKKGSAIGTNYAQANDRTATGYNGFGRVAKKIARNIDVCPTLAALAGIQVPRQNQGLFLDHVLRVPSYQGTDTLRVTMYTDLLKEYRHLAKAYLTEIGATIPVWFDDSVVGGNNDETILKIRDQLEKIQKYHLEERDKDESKSYVYGITIPIGLVVMIGLFFVMKKTSLKTTGTSRRAMAIGFVIVAIYYCLAICLFLLIFGAIIPVDEEFVWNSSQFDTPEYATNAAILVLIGLVILIIPVHRWCWAKKAGCCGYSIYPWIESYSSETLDSCRSDNEDLVYLMIQSYVLYWTIAALIIIIVIGSPRALFLEDFYETPYVDRSTWIVRYQMAHTIVMSFVLVATVIIKNIIAIIGVADEDLSSYDRRGTPHFSL